MNKDATINMLKFVKTCINGLVKTCTNGLW